MSSHNIPFSARGKFCIRKMEITRMRVAVKVLHKKTAENTKIYPAIGIKLISAYPSTTRRAGICTHLGGITYFPFGEWCFCSLRCVSPLSKSRRAHSQKEWFQELEGISQRQRAKYAPAEHQKEFPSPPTDSQLPTVKWTGFLLYGPWVEDMQHQNLTTAFMLKTEIKWNGHWLLREDGLRPKKKNDMSICAHTHSKSFLFQFHSFGRVRRARFYALYGKAASVTSVSLK